VAKVRENFCFVDVASFTDTATSVVVKNPADFIGSVLGQSESQTKAILSNAVGKVLVIDEVSPRSLCTFQSLMIAQAYMLYGRSGTGGTADPYKTAVIDTIVAEVQSVPGEDRCLLMLVSASAVARISTSDIRDSCRDTRNLWRRCSGQVQSNADARIVLSY
jgi:hypothetical protein